MNIRSVKAVLLAGVMAGWAVPAAAQESANLAGATPDTEAGGGEIIVTARRKVESLQDVPQTVNAVKAEDFANYNILAIGDISKVVSGLQIEGDVISMRGVRFVTIANAPIPTVATYLNDVPIPAVDFNIASFDIGQVEVLRGPQGTVRGIASPSGAITASTRRADLSEIGGYASGSVGTLHNYNLQAAIGVPLIKDVLGLRVAGVINKGDANGVLSANSAERPFNDARGIRVSLRAEPTDNLQGNLVYQRVVTRVQSFGSAVFGNGAPGGGIANTAPGYNGPVLTIDDNRAVGERRNNIRNTTDVIMGNLGWTFAGQHLAYVGSHQKSTTITTVASGDTGNSLINGGDLTGAIQNSPRTVNTHEIRLSSDDRIAGIFDYVLGYFNLSDNSPVSAGAGIIQYLDGAFGPPGTAPNPGAFNPRFTLAGTVNLPRLVKERSFFANLTAHIGDKLEISGGARRIHSENLRDMAIDISSGFIALPVSSGTCGAIGGQFGATYPGICDRPIAAPASVVIAKDNLVESDAWIYDASISYRVTPDLMVYGHFGTSWRPGGFGVGLSNGLNNPFLNQLIFQRPESSKSYEAGLKWTFLDGKARLNLTYYHQDFTDFLFTVPGNIRYLSYSSPTSSPSVGDVPNMTINRPAKVDGIDVDLAFQVTSRWSLSGNFSWQNGKVKGPLPCNDSNFDGVPDDGVPADLVSRFQQAGTFVALCPIDAASSASANWSLRVQTDYRAPLSDRVEGFVRGLLAYQPTNRNSSQTYTVPGYALLDLFLGIRSPNGQWEVAAYGKNITNTRTLIARGSGAILAPEQIRQNFGGTGYTTYELSPRREFGLNLRMSFGSDAPR